jgi:hypothetical protein
VKGLFSGAIKGRPASNKSIRSASNTPPQPKSYFYKVKEQKIKVNLCIICCAHERVANSRIPKAEPIQTEAAVARHGLLYLEGNNILLIPHFGNPPQIAGKRARLNGKYKTTNIGKYFVFKVVSLGSASALDQKIRSCTCRGGDKQ